MGSFGEKIVQSSPDFDWKNNNKVNIDNISIKDTSIFKGGGSDF